jgi:hypothetical protein
MQHIELLNTKGVQLHAARFVNLLAAALHAPSSKIVFLLTPNSSVGKKIKKIKKIIKRHCDAFKLTRSIPPFLDTFF